MCVMAFPVTVRILMNQNVGFLSVAYFTTIQFSLIGLFKRTVRKTFTKCLLCFTNLYFNINQHFYLQVGINYILKRK